MSYNTSADKSAATSNNTNMKNFYNNSMNEIYPNFKIAVNMKKAHYAMLKSIFFVGIALLGATHSFAQTAITCLERSNIKIAAPTVPAMGVTYSWLMPVGATRTNAVGSPDTLIVFNATSLPLETTHRVRLVASNGTCSDTSFIDLSFPNCPPTAVDDADMMNQNATLNSTVASNDSDETTPLSGLIFSTVTALPLAQGSFTLNSNGTYTFIPNTNYTGVVTVDYRVCDPGGLCDTATLTITVNMLNTAPIALDDVNATNAGAQATGTVASNDTDLEGGVLTFTSLTSVPMSQGIFVLNTNGTYTFTPSINPPNSVVINYKICDAGGLCDTAKLTISINRFPIALNDTTGTYKNKTLNNTVAFNDKDPDGNLNVNSFVKISNPINGSIVFNNNGTYAYTPITGFLGRDSFKYKVCDNGTPNLCDTAVLVLTVVDALCADQLASVPLINITFGSGARDNLPNVVAGATTDQIYAPSGGINDDYYAIANNGNAAGGWAANIPDHTDGSATGRLMVINSAHHDTIEFLRLPINGLCTNTKYQFSSWIRSISNASDLPNLGFDIRSATTDSILYSVGSGNVPFGSWFQHGFTFNSGNATSVTLVLRNNNPAGSAGNDLVIDDIQFTHCGSSVTAMATGSPSVCTGTTASFDGSIPSGYTAPQYLWQKSTDGGTTWNDIPAATALNYSFTATLANNGHKFRMLAAETGNINTPSCRITSNAVTLTVNALPTAIITETDASCAANDDKIVVGGTATLTASGGVTYAWNTTETTNAINVTPSISTTYTVTVSNASGCTVTAIKTIDIITAPTVSITKTSNITCATPSITLNALPSSGATYAWNNGVTTQNQIVNASGSYTVTVTNATNGCAANANINVFVDTNLVATLSKNNDIDCNNLTATLTVNSATSPLSYAWLDTTATTSLLVVSTAKAYQVTVTNTATGCFLILKDTIIATNPTLTNVVSTNPTLASCPLLNDGSITLSASGYNLRYSIDNGTTWQASNVFSNVSGGSYDIKVKNNITNCEVAYAINPLVLTAPSCNEPPVISATPATTNEDTATLICRLISDPNVGNTFTTTLLCGGSNGTLGTPYISGSDVCVSYTPNLNFNGLDSVCIAVCDQGGLCDTVKIPITVNPINDASVAMNDVNSTNEDTPVSNTVASNDSDLDNTASELSYTQIGSTPNTEGSFSLNNDGTYTFTPALNFNGSTVVTYKVCDPSGLCDTATLTITVNPINDAPVAQNDFITTNEDAATLGSVASNDSDLDNTASELSYTQIGSTPNTEGSFTLNADGSYTFIPALNFNGSTVVTYKVCDPSGLCDTATLTITVNPINDAPVAQNDVITTNEDASTLGSIASNDSDLDNTASELSYTQVGSTPNTEGVFTLNTDGSYTFIPTLNFNGSTVVTYKVCDPSGLCDTATLTITVNPINDAPVAMNDVVSTDEDVATLGSVASNDSDLDNIASELSYTQIGSTPNTEGSFTLNADGSYTFTPALNFNGSTVVTYKVCDPSGLCDTATLTITINPINDAPVAMNDVNSTDEDTSVSNTVASNDSYLDNTASELSYTQIGSTPNTEGSFTLSADGSYTFTPALNFNGSTVVTYKVCDPSGLCDTAILTITINPINDAPVAISDVNSTNEDTPVSNTVASNDSDLDNIASELSYTQIGITPNTEGSFTLNNDGSYTFTPALNFNGIVTVNYKVCDPSGLCDTAILTITINPINDAPVAINDVITKNEDASTLGSVASNDSDLDNTASELSYTQIGLTPNTEGSFTLNNDGTYTFTPALNFNGSTVVMYKVCDPSGLCDTATLTITINPINDAPVAMNDVNSTNEDTPISNTVASNDSDLDNTASELSYTQIGSTPNTEGAFTLNNDGSYTFTPAFNFNGSTVVMYKVCDPSGLCDTATLAITINPINDAPVAQNDVITTNEDAATLGSVASNDSDLDNTASELSYTQIGSTPNTEGSFTLNNDGTYTFTPALNFNGSTVVKYKVCDPSGLCDTATLTITINPINDAPVAMNDVNSTNEDTSVSNTVASNDSDLDNTASELSYTQIGSTPNTEGSFNLNNDGTYTFTPALNFNGSTIVTYKVCDPSGLCDTATLTITVNPINDAPVAMNDVNSTNEDTSVSNTLASNDSDLDNTASELSYTQIGLTPNTEGLFTLNNDGTYRFTPALNFNGIVTVNYKVCDPSGLCDTATLTITVNPINDTPVAQNDVNATNEDTSVSNTVASNDSDLDNIASELSYTQIGSMPNTEGSFTLNADGSYTFTPALNFNGSTVVTYKVCDPSGLCDTTTLTITINPINDAPLAINDVNSTNEDTPVSNTVASNDSDLDNTASELSYTQIGSTPNTEGLFNLNNDGTYTFTPALNFNGSTIVTYRVCDPIGLCDTATLSITVNPINDSPVAQNDVITTDEDASTLGSVASNDSDLDNIASELSYTQIGITSNTEGSFTLNNDGTYTFTPALNFNGSTVVTYKVCDPSGLCDTAILTIIVNPINDAPVAQNDVITTNEDAPTLGSVASNDSDLDNTASELSYTQIGSTPNTEGSFTLNPNGSYTFTPALNVYGSTVVTYKVCDPSGLCDNAILTITVNPINDAPVAQNDVITTNEDAPTLGSVASNDSDLDNTASELSYTQIGITPNTEGSFTLNNDGTYTFTPALNFNGIVTVNYKVCDPSGLCDTAILTITIKPINDAPVAINDVNSTDEDTSLSNTVASDDSDLDNTASELSYTQIGITPNTEGAFTLNNDGTYTFIPALNFNGTAVVTYKVCDPSGLCDTAILTITVNPINDAPVAMNDVNSTDEDTAVSNTVASNDSDLDNTASELSYTQIGNTPNTEGSFTLNPNGSYTFTPALNFNGSTVVTYKVCDPSGLCDTATLTITVNPINDAPVAQNDVITTNEDASTLGSVASNDSDLDNTASELSYTQIGTTPNTEGSFTLNKDGTYTFTPALNFNGTTVVTYKVCDPSGLCDTASLTITVNPINDAPVAQNDVITTNEDASTLGSVASNDSDLDNTASELSYTQIGSTPNTEGSFTLNNDGNYTFTPALNFNGSTVVTYKVCDPSGLCDTATLTITINPINDAPVAMNDVVSTDEDVATLGSVASNDSDLDNIASELSYTQIGSTPNTEGAFTLNNDGTYTFIPALNFNGTAVVTYKVCDPSGLCDTATLTITINPINDAPVAMNDVNSTNEDTPVSNTVASNDSDLDNTASELSYTQIGSTQNTEGLFNLNNDGTYTFTPALNFNGSTIVTYRVCDPSGLCDTATLTITVNPINDAPVAQNDIVSTDEDASTLGSVASNDSDLDNTASELSYTQIGSTPNTEGSFNLNNDGTYTFTPALNFNGVVIVNYKVCDPSGLCDTAILTITVNPINDAPVAMNDVNSTNEDTPVSNTVASNDSDLDNTASELSYTQIGITSNTEGSFTLNNDGTYTFTPALNFNGSTVVTYKVCDPSGLCDTATLTITVNPINDAPVAQNDVITTNEDASTLGSVASNDSDLDNNASELSYTQIGLTPNTEGSFTLNNDGSYTFTPALNFNGSTVVTYKVCDPSGLCDTASLTITFNPINDAPVAQNDVNSTTEDTSVSNTVASNDSDLDNNASELSYTQIGITPNTEGSFTLNNDGTYTFTPALNFNGSTIVTYKVCDPSGLCDTATLTITVNPINDAPVATNDVIMTNEDAPTLGSVTSNDSDLDNTASELSYTQIGLTSNTEGSFTLNNDGTYTFTPALNFNGSTVVTYKVCDPSGLCDTATLTITVNPINDAPVAQNDVITTNEDAPTLGSVASNDSDLDNTASELSYTQIGSTPITEGSFTLNNDGSYTFTPALNFNGSTVVTYKVCDPSGLCDTATLTITVNPINDAPVAQNDVNSTNEDTPVSNTVASNDSDLDNTASELSFTQIGSTPNTEGSFTLNNDGTYTFTPALNFNGSTVVTYKVCDPSGLCDTATLTIIVNPINDAPVAQNDVITTNEDAPTLGSVASNDSDLDNTASELSYTQIGTTPNTEGSFNLNPNGTYTFTPALNFNGSTVVTYKVCDPSGICDTATLTITVNPINDAPVVTNTTVNTSEDVVTTGVVTATDVDNNLNPNGFATTDLPLHGTITMNPNGSYTYTPNPNFNGVDSVHYKVCDLGTPIYCATATLIFNVNLINDAPIANNDTKSTNEDTAVTGSATASDIDGNLDNNGFATTDLPLHGTITMNPNGSYTYTPNLNFNGVDSVHYKVCDLGMPIYCATATLIFNVNPVNDTPIAANTIVNTSEDVITTGIVTATDVDNNLNPNGFATTDLPLHGTITMNLNGSFTYKPNPNFNGVDSVHYKVCDLGNPIYCATATLVFNVNPVNDAPIATNTTVNTSEDVVTTGVVTATDVDNNLNSNGFATTDLPLHGTITMNPNGSYTYTPNPNFNGVDSVHYKVCDLGNPIYCATATLIFNINPVNDAPVVSITPISIEQDSTTKQCFTVTDKDANDTFTASICNTPTSKGTAQISIENSRVCLTYKAPKYYSGPDSVCISVCDSSNACVSVIVPITVTGCTDTANPDIICPMNVEVNIVGSVISDRDKFILNSKIADNCQGINISFAKPTAVDFCGAVNVTQTSGLISGSPFSIGSHTLIFEAKNKSGKTATCQTEVLVKPAELLNFSDLTLCKNDSVILKANAFAGGKYQWTNPNKFVSIGSEYLASRVENAALGQYILTATFGKCTLRDTVNVGMYKSSVAINDAYVVGFDDVLSKNVALNDSILRGSKNLIKLKSGALKGSIVFNNDGTFQYTPKVGFVGIESFDYEVCSDVCPTTCALATAKIDVVQGNRGTNVISPNDDGKNDAFEIEGYDPTAPGSELSDIKVFNQWGDMVYKTTWYKNDWKGDYKDLPLPAGTYYYIFTKNPTAKAVKGYVTILK
jgi:large repetitive protein